MKNVNDTIDVEYGRYSGMTHDSTQLHAGARLPLLPHPSRNATLLTSPSRAYGCNVASLDSHLRLYV